MMQKITRPPGRLIAHDGRSEPTSLALTARSELVITMQSTEAVAFFARSRHPKLDGDELPIRWSDQDRAAGTAISHLIFIDRRLLHAIQLLRAITIFSTTILRVSRGGS